MYQMIIDILFVTGSILTAFAGVVALFLLLVYLVDFVMTYTLDVMDARREFMEFLQHQRKRPKGNRMSDEEAARLKQETSRKREAKERERSDS